MTFRRKQRGVALIIALILVALAALLATKLTFDGWLERRRTIGVMAAEQAWYFAYGAEALAADVLSAPGSVSNEVTLDQPWAQPSQPLPLTPEDNPEGEPFGTLQGALEDMQGRFNLNNLGHTIRPGGGNTATPGIGGNSAVLPIPDPQPLEQFQRLLVSVGLDPKWAAMARDWIDADDIPDNTNGAEDAVYTSQTPPYRTGNWPMTTPTELMNLPGFGADRYRLIAPYVTALPGTDVQINICTAPALVLESLAKGLNGEWSGNPQLLATERKRGCFPDRQTFAHIIAQADPKAQLANRYGESSQYFRLTTRVTLGTSEFTLYSLLSLGGTGGGGKVTPLLRTFGTL
jgi:general secretion pathway protein K